MKKIFSLLFVLFTLNHTFAQSNPMSAAMDKVKLNFMIMDGKPFYAVYYNGKAVVKNSAMGFKFADDSTFTSGFKITSTQTKTVDSTWAPVWGEVSQVRNHYQELIVHLTKDNPYKALDIVFRVFADGVGFRYVFPKQPNLKYLVVTDELTEFAMAGDHKTFWIPGDYDTNEYPYTTSKLSAIDNRGIVKNSTDIAVRVAPDAHAVQTPLMMKSADGLYINIHEAGLVNFPAMQLHVDNSTYKLTASLVPDAVGTKAFVHAPFSSPWRTIIVSDKATDILASKLILNLNDPSKIEDPSWIKPMKFVGVWWEMQTGKSTWSYSDYPDSLSTDGKLVPSGKHGATTANVKKYIDFAAANGIHGVLVEGWNKGWEGWFGNWKENVFSFVTPYPDFDIGYLTKYATSKGVTIIMHNETSGSATDYERQMDTAFKFMNKYGYTSVKTGYVGKIIPRGEHHDGQWMVQHYTRVAQMAANHHIMLDAHCATRVKCWMPTNLCARRDYSAPIRTGWPAKRAGVTNTTLSARAINPNTKPLCPLPA